MPSSSQTEEPRSLTEVQWEAIRDPDEEFLKFLTENKCARLKQYLVTAQGFLKFAKDMDDSGKALRYSNAKPLAEDEMWLVDQIAEKIEVQGLGLRERLKTLGKEMRIKEICNIIASLVLAHVRDTNCKAILNEFINAGFNIREIACDV